MLNIIEPNLYIPQIVEREKGLLTEQNRLSLVKVLLLGKRLLYQHDAPKAIPT